MQEESGGISPQTVISHRRGEPFLGERRDPRSSPGEHPHRGKVETGQEQPEARESGGSQKLCQESFRPGGGHGATSKLLAHFYVRKPCSSRGGVGRRGVLPGQDFCDSIPVFFGTTERVEKTQFVGLRVKCPGGWTCGLVMSQANQGDHSGSMWLAWGWDSALPRKNYAVLDKSLSVPWSWFPNL